MVPGNALPLGTLRASFHRAQTLSCRREVGRHCHRAVDHRVSSCDSLQGGLSVFGSLWFPVHWCRSGCSGVCPEFEEGHHELVLPRVQRPLGPPPLPRADSPLPEPCQVCAGPSQPPWCPRLPVILRFPFRPFPPRLSLSRSGSCTEAPATPFLLVLFIPSLLPNCSARDDTPAPERGSRLLPARRGFQERQGHTPELHCKTFPSRNS